MNRVVKVLSLLLVVNCLFGQAALDTCATQMDETFIIERSIDDPGFFKKNAAAWLECAVRHKDLKKQILIHQCLGHACYAQDSLERAIHWYKQAIELINKYGVDAIEIKSVCLEKIANAFYYLGYYGRARNYAYESLIYARKTSSDIVLASCYAIIGETYHLQGRFDQALLYYDSCYQLDLSYNDPIYIAEDLCILGRIHVKLGSTNKGFELLEEALRMTDSLKAPDTYSKVLNAMGLASLAVEDYEASRNYISRALSVAKLHRDTLLMVNRHMNLATVHIEFEAYENALLEIAQVEALIDIERDPIRNALVSRNLAMIYYGLIDYNQSRFFLDKAYILAQQNQLLPEIEKIYRLRSQLAKSEEAYKDALYYTDKADSLNEIIYSIDARNEADAILLKYDMLDNAQIVVRKDLSHVQQPYTLLWILIGFGVLGLFIRYGPIRKVQKDTLTKDQANGISKETVHLADALTNRELEVVKLMVQGKTNKAISDQLFISVNTTKFHLKNIYQKIQVQNRYEAIHFFMQNDLPR